MAQIIRTENRTYAPAPSSVGVLARLLHILTVRKQRLQLKDLPDAALRDMGLTRDQVDEEANRPIWDVPNYWTK